MMRAEVIRRILQITALTMGEFMVFSAVTIPLWIVAVIVVILDSFMILLWTLTPISDAKPKHARRRRRVGPPMEWID